jgi:hypothetical protein
LHGVGDLILKFNNAGYYRYKDVDSDTYWAFEEAESKGKYFAANIKNKFVTEKLELPKPEKKIHGSDVPLAWPFPTGKKP